MFRVKFAAPLMAVLALAVGTQAIAAKPVLSAIVEITLPHITADGEIDEVNEGVEEVALVEVFYKKGLTVVEITSQGTVDNLSGKKFRTTDPAGFDFIIGPDAEITRFDYSVSKTGKAVLRVTAAGNIPIGI